MTSLARRALPVSLSFLPSIFQKYVVDIYSTPNYIISSDGHENDGERIESVIFIDS